MAMLEFGTSRMVEEADLSSAGTVVGVGSSVNALAWSRESSLAAGCGDGTVLHVDLRREDVRELPATSPVRALSWCPGGELLAAGYDDGDARVWIVDAASAVLVGEQPRAHAVRAVAWSPGRQRLAVASGARIEVWAMPFNERLLDFAAHDAEVTALAWSPDGATLASASRDHTVALWERDGRSMVRHAVLPGHDGPAYALAWSPAGSTLATGGGDHVVRMWDAATGDQRTVLDGHDAWIDALAWSPTEPHLLASGGGDRRVQVWDVERGEQFAAFDGHESTVLALAWSPDGATLASGSDDETIQFWTCW